MARTILVVEDDRATLSSLREAFELWEYDGRFAATPTSALIAVEHVAALDVLFADYELAGSMNGIELDARLRERFPDLRLVLTSAYPRADIAVPAGACFLQKPYSLADLAVALSVEQPAQAA